MRTSRDFSPLSSVEPFVFRLVFETPMPCTPDELWLFHSSAEALLLLKPADARISFLDGPEALQVREGALHRIRVLRFGVFPVVWHARIGDVHPPHSFTDIAEKSPFKHWKHQHEFLPHDGASLLRDTLEFELPFGVLGALVARFFIVQDVRRMFAHRHRVTLEHFQNSIPFEN